MLQKGVGWTTSSSILGTARLAVRRRELAYQLRHQLRQGCQLRQLFQFGHPQPRGRPAQLRHQLPQARRRSPLPGSTASFGPLATSETASRMAASRSATPASSAARDSPPVGCRAAALGIAEPSSRAIPAAPAGAIPHRILWYLSRSDITIALLGPRGSYSKGRRRRSNSRIL